MSDKKRIGNQIFILVKDDNNGMGAKTIWLLRLFGENYILPREHIFYIIENTKSILSINKLGGDILEYKWGKNEE